MVKPPVFGSIRQFGWSTGRVETARLCQPGIATQRLWNGATRPVLPFPPLHTGEQVPFQFDWRIHLRVARAMR